MALSGVVMREYSIAIHIAKFGVPTPHKFDTIKGNREVMEALIRELRESSGMGYGLGYRNP